MRHIFVDRLEFDDAAQVRTTGQGFIVATPRVARTGIQIYSGAEVQKNDMQTVRVFRPEAEVFKKDAFASLAHTTITDDHPSQMVDASNWSKLAVGQADGDVVRDGEFIRVPLALMDAVAVAKYKAGKAELSVGYTCDLDFTPGIDPVSGLAYDAVQRNIRANHIALVDRARGGHNLRIGDDGTLVADASKDSAASKTEPKKETTVMSDKATKTILVDGISVTMEQRDAEFVQRALDAATKATESALARVAQLTADAKAKEESEEEEKKKKEELFKAKDAEIVALKAQVADMALTPEKINTLVNDRADCIGKALVVLGDKAPKDIQTMDTDAVRKLVVDTKLGDDAKGWGAGEIGAAFKSLTAGVKVGDAKTAPAGGVHQMANHFALTPQQVQDGSKEPAGYAAYKKRLEDGYKSNRKVAQ